VDVDFALDPDTGVVSWRFTSIDPVTGQQTRDPLAGFLPPNQVPPEGDGWVTYTVRPRSTLVTGDVIDAQARIVFDTNDPIDTVPAHFNTIDASPITIAAGQTGGTITANLVDDALDELDETIVGFGAADSGWRNARGNSDLLVQIIDDGSNERCGISGEWTSIAGAGFRGDACRSNGGTGADTVSWSFWVLPGQYRVAATWTAGRDQALFSPLTISDGPVPVGTVRVNQRREPQDFTEQGVGWRDLGTFSITGNRLTVTLRDDTRLAVVADAIRIERVATPVVNPQAVDQLDLASLAREEIDLFRELGADVNAG